MKILFVCLGNPFTPTMLYKENYFIKAAVQEGHEVLVVATREGYSNGEKILIDSGEQYIDGYKLKRISYQKVFNSFLTDKVRKSNELFDIILEFRPNLIFYNCPQIYNIQDIKEIKKQLPDVKVVLDFSTKYLNSARNWISLNILHKVIYKNWLHKSLPYIDKIYYISAESKEFVKEVYKIQGNILEYNNLPGEVIPRTQKNIYRSEFIKKYQLEQESIIFVHSGKMGVLKRTIELLEAFVKNKDPRFRLFIAGRLEDDIKDEAMKLIKSDYRINYIGFLKGDELTQLICSADMYLQPGTISQTSQTAICCGCPITFIKCPTNEELFNGNGYLINELAELDRVFKDISHNPQQLKHMAELSYQLGKKDLDYVELFHRVLKVFENVN